MKILYFSKTGNIRKFCTKLDLEAIEGTKSTVMDDDYILITYTTGFGEVPKEVEGFLSSENNIKKLKYVCSSGNKNWGANYAKAADLLADRYNVPVLFKFELSGNKHDVNKFKELYEGLSKNGK